MSISVADNFSYQGSKPLDARVKFDTRITMKDFEESKLYDGCLAYVTDEKAYYTYDSSNNVDVYTGRWRQFVPVGGSLSNEISGHNVYSTSEKLVGQWKDGKPLYQKTFTGTMNKTNTIGTDVSTEVLLGVSVDTIVDVNGYTIYEGVARPITNVKKDNNVIKETRYVVHTNSVLSPTEPNRIVLFNSYFLTDMPFYITIQYTKTTDSAQSIGSINEYSTTEKIVGTWIDGKPLYQRVFSFPGAYHIPANTWTTILEVSFSNLANIIKSTVVSPDENNPSELNYLTVAYNKSEGAFKALHTRSIQLDIHEPSYIICQYTKTTD